MTVDRFNSALVESSHFVYMEILIGGNRII
ncbi:Hypothetical protein DPCES_0027 [Desulfitobacterium hafniense]|uniref:Uncharacterized protein n=1 Tax=Desulfitobacterium hafniense TaxID=49338 RepID=A0A098AUC4_DESHA|nr:Hypothetical protein DPCES_0027 [Desulfitobacterium hafniense]